MKNPVRYNKNSSSSGKAFSVVRVFYLSFGLFFVAIGFIGIFLPVLPTTPFLILAAACFARSSVRLEKWLLSHRKFGPLLISWRERGAIPVWGKRASLLGCLLGFTMFLWRGDPDWFLALTVAAVMAFGVGYVFSRPDA